MSFNFTVKEFILGGGTGTPTFTFYRRGFNLGTSGSTPSWQDIILSGNGSLTLTNAKANGLNYVTLFGGTEQRNLPKGYTQYEYLRSTGTQYIDLGYKGNGNTKVKIKFKYHTSSSATGSGRVFGSRNTSQIDAFAIGSASGIVSVEGTNKVFWCYDGQPYFVDDTAFGLDVWKTVVFSATEHTIDGVTVGDDYTVTEFETPYNLKLFGFDNNGTIGVGYVDIAYCQLWDNDVLVRDLIPAKNSSNVLGMYDTVTNTFLTNQGTGSFTAGADVTVPSPTTPLSIVCNNGTIKARHQSGLPLGYTLLDYVVFDSTQVIDTGFIPDNNSRIESKCYRTGDDCWFYGASPSNPRITLYHSRTGTCRWGYQSRSNVGFVADTEYTIIEDKNGLNINGVDNPWTSGTDDDFTCDRSLTIGNNNGSSGTRYFAGNFYYMKIYNNGVLVRDFVPCQNALNVVGLYDRVNGVFYTDTGLVAGNTVSDPVEIYTDGTVETVEVDTTGDTATAEMLLKVGDYQDIQSILNGNVTKNVGILILDGTESWQVATGTGYKQFYSTGTQGVIANSVSLMSTIAPYGCTASTRADYDFGCYSGGNGNLCFQMIGSSTINTTTDWINYLSEQYQNNTPVIVIYPLAEPTTETVTAQPLSIQAGTNIVEIAQASIDNLGLEVSFKQTV